jgi:hypothetical protein
LQHEPKLALAGGTSGIDFITKILEDAQKCLSPNGVLIMETGGHKTLIEQKFPTVAFAWLTTSAGDDDVLVVSPKSYEGVPYRFGVPSSNSSQIEVNRITKTKGRPKKAKSETVELD